MKDIGECLKENRINNGVSIEEVSEDLNLSVSEIENIESGNIRAFKDIYSLKDLVNDYAKYLGLDLEKINDDFNDFMFEHTSKISLDELINTGELKKAEAVKEVYSPYTKIPKPQKNYKPLFIAVIAVVACLFIIFLMLNFFINKNEVSHELMSNYFIRSDF